MISGVKVHSNVRGQHSYPLFEKVKKDKNGETKSSASISIVYGPNGAGKTTLARALGSTDSDLANGISFADTSGNSVAAKEVPRHLYNEDFILHNFRVVEGDVGAIVLLGDSVDNAKEIDALSNTNADLQACIEELEEQKEVLERSGEGSIKKARKTFTQSLNTSGWGENYCSIKEAQKPPNYSDNTLDRITSLYKSKVIDSSNEFDINACEEKLQEQIGNIKRATSAGTPVTIGQRLHKVALTSDPEVFGRTLSETPSRVSGGQLVEAISAALSDPQKKDVTQKSGRLIVDEHVDPCPLCFQSIDDSHRSILSSALDKIYNQDRTDLKLRVEELKEDLQIRPISLGQEIEIILPSEVLTEFTRKKELVEAKQSAIISVIDGKLRELETPATVNLEGFFDAVGALNDCIVRINDIIDEHNDTVENFNKVLGEALELNDLVCGYRARAELQDFTKFKETHKQVSTELFSKSSALNQNLKAIDELKSASQNTTDALSLINSFLQIIFVESERLELSPSGNGYSVTCRGNQLSPSALSTGERNILSLAYFFTSIFSSISDYNDPKEHRLVILDDPLSSFDEDNRYGVLVFLRQMAARIASTGKGQVVFFTHDARLVFDLCDALKNAEVSVATSKLHSRTLTSLNLEESNKYKSMLERILNYALLGTDHSPVKTDRDLNVKSETELLKMDIANVVEHKVPTGNEARQVLEAFSEFNYGKNITDLMQDQHVREALQSTGRAFAEYFGSSLYKLFLHGESHTGDAMKAGNYSLLQLAKDEDRVYLCREMICLISVLMPDHIAARLNLTAKNKGIGHLPQSTDLNEYLQDWGKAIENRALPELQPEKDLSLASNKV